MLAPMLDIELCCCTKWEASKSPATVQRSTLPVLLLLDANAEKAGTTVQGRCVGREGTRELSSTASRVPSIGGAVDILWRSAFAPAHCSIFTAACLVSGCVPGVGTA